MSDNVHFCSECGARLTAGGRFCEECGTPVGNMPAASRNAPAASGAPTAPVKRSPAPPAAAPEAPATEPTRRPAAGPAASQPAAIPAVATRARPSDWKKRALLLLALAFVLLAVPIVVLVVTLRQATGGNGWDGAEIVKSVMPGLTTMKELAKRFGEYDQVGTYGNNLEWVRYRIAGNGVATLTVWLDTDRIVRWGKVEPEPGVALEQVRRSLPGLETASSITQGNRFAGKELPGELYSYAETYVYVEDDTAKELWLIPFSVNHESMIAEMYWASDYELDVSGTGDDPRPYN